MPTPDSRVPRDLALTLLVFAATAAPAHADSELFYSELNIVGGYYNGETDLMRSHPQTAVGFDYLRKWANEQGDFLTTGLQFRLIYDTMDGVIEPDLMDAYANFRRANGTANIKVGKFEIPYGLEPVLDTHGTLLQSNQHHNLGNVWDWGVDLNGILTDVDYQVALLTGDFTENLPHHEQESWLITGRVGSPRTGVEQAWGLSLAAGTVVPGDHGEHVADEPMEPHSGEEEEEAPHEEGSAVDILRLGADYTIFGPEDTWRAEASVGTDDSDPMASAWLRWTRTPYDHDRWTYALQAEGVWLPPHREDDFAEVSGAITYRLDNAATVTLLASHAFTTLTGDPEDRLLLQFYYFAQ